MNSLVTNPNPFFSSFLIPKLQELIVENPSLSILLIDFFYENKNNVDFQEIIAHVLGEVSYGDMSAMRTLIYLLSVCESESLGQKVAHSLIKILDAKLQKNAIHSLRKLTENSRHQVDSYSRSSAYEVLWHCAQNMSYPDFYEAWHSPLPDNSELNEVGGE